MVMSSGLSNGEPHGEHPALLLPAAASHPSNNGGAQAASSILSRHVLSSMSICGSTWAFWKRTGWLPATT